MSIDVAFFGFCAVDADTRTSQAGKAWTRLRVGVGKDEEVQWLSVAVFGKAADAAAQLHKGDRIYVEGTLKLDSWRGFRTAKSATASPSPHSSASVHTR
jgi:single-strand DNA-binding protein